MGMEMRGTQGLRAACIASSLASLLVSFSITSFSAEPGDYVAGTAPDRRPDSAPRITAFEKSADWYARGTQGVVGPIPPSLKFLNDQGGWFTPFIHPGMGGKYDLRGLRRDVTSGAPPQSNP